MGFKTTTADRVEAVAYARDYSADSVYRDLKEGAADSFSEEDLFSSYSYYDGWKVYKITVVIEEV